MDRLALTWLDAFTEKWRSGTAQGRAPHAALLAGPPGTGKRAAAAWMVRHKLGLAAAGERPAYPFELPVHADAYWLTQPEDHNAILIEQVRDLVAELVLTSYTGHGKAAVIEPANAMTANAANSLLKTLEEPPGDTLLILVTDRPGRLPATIFSRCQRFDFRVPGDAEARAWLERLRPGGQWAEALRAAGGAPLAAIAAAERQATSAGLARDFTAVGRGAASPVAVAANWARLEPGYVLEWLARRIEDILRGAAGGVSPAGSGIAAETVRQRMDSRKLFCYLDDINRLRAQPGGTFNVQLALEGLLIDWATGLQTAGGGCDAAGC